MGNGRSRGVMLPAYYGLLIALAFVFSYIESLIPFSVGISWDWETLFLSLRSILWGGRRQRRSLWCA